MTALLMASRNGHVEVVKILLRSGANIDLLIDVSLTLYINWVVYTSMFEYMFLFFGNAHNYMDRESGLL